MVNEYIFEVQLRAVVRVRATNENVARKVVPTVLGSPGSVEIELANQNNAAIGSAATVTEVDFEQKNDPSPLRQPVEASTSRSQRMRV
jgi:hypothetical protein